MTVAPETTLPFLPALSNQTKNLGFVDRFGDGSSLAPLHAAIDSSGARIDPATSERQDAALAALQALATALAGTLNVAATSLPLPAGAAKDTSLAAIVTALQATLAVSQVVGGSPVSPANRLPVDIARGQSNSVGSIPVVLSTDGPFTTNFGATTDVAVTNPTSAGSLLAITKGVLSLLSGTLKTAAQSNAPRVTATANLAAANASLTLAVDGMSTIAMQISGTWVGTVAVYGSMDGGVTYPYLLGLKPVGSAGGASVTSFTVNGGWDRSAAAYTHIQAQMPVFTSGSASVLLSAFNGGKFARVEAPASDPLPVNPGIGSPVESSAVPTALTGLNLLSTQAASSRIGFWFCQNQSANEIIVALDDGAGNNLSVFLLNPTAAGQQGGSMGSADTGPHIGRIRVYGAAGSNHALRVQ